MLNTKINELKKRLIEEASWAENMVEKSVNGLVERKKGLLKEVIENYEPQLNDFEIEMDELCIKIIALYHPEAENLRTVLTILKMNDDLERIGDLAVNIAQSALFLIDKPPVKPLIDIPRMADEAIEMLKDSIDAFINNDAKLAKSVCERDSIVDNLRDQVLRELITYMVSDPSTIERAIHLIRISRNLERVADLSTNIAEDVVFMVEGKILKHHKIEEFGKE